MKNKNKVDLRGYGGKETEIAALFGHTVCSARLYDAVASDGKNMNIKKDQRHGLTCVNGLTFLKRTLQPLFASFVLTVKREYI